MQNKTLKVMSAVALMAGTAMAAAPRPAVQDVKGGGNAGTGGIYAYTYADEFNSSVVTGGKELRAASGQLTGLVMDRLQGSADGMGGAAGMSMKNWTLWAKAAYNNVDDNSHASQWDANFWTGVVGADYRFNNMFLGGMAVNYTYENGKSGFNRGDIRDHAYGVMPYLSFSPSKCVSFDAMVGYNRVNKNRSRINTQIGATTRPLGNRVTGKVNSDRFFAAGFLTGKHSWNRFNLMGRLGVSHGNEKQKSFTESDNTRYLSGTWAVTQGHARLQAGYKADDKFEPYAFGVYSYDFSLTRAPFEARSSTVSAVDLRQDPNRQYNRNTYGGGLGLNMKATNNWSGNVEGSYQQSKKVKDTGVKVLARYKF